MSCTLRWIRLTPLAGALAVALTGSCARGTAVDISWGEATQLSPGAAVVFATAPKTNALTIAWVSAPGGGNDGRLYVRSEIGTGATVELLDSLGRLTIYGEVPPKIAYAPDGTLYAAYLVTKSVPGHKWPVNTLRFASSPDGGAHWTGPRTVSSDTPFGGSTDDHALLAGADGTLYLTWLAATGPESHTWLSRSEDKGLTWSAPLRIDQGASCPCCRTALTTGPDGTLYVAWRKIYRDTPGETEARDIAVARSTDHGRGWSEPVRVHADEWRVTYCPDAGPSIKVGGDGTVHIAWWTGKAGAAGVYYAGSTDGARVFGAPVPLGVAAASRAAHVQLALGSPNTVVAAWDDGTRQSPRIVVRTSRDGGRSFGETQALSLADRTVGYPVVALRADTVTVAWQERTLEEAGADSAHQSHGAINDTVSSARHIKPVASWRIVARTGNLSR
ncbi:MAG: sialidase family protein [Gemmatimonadota bacterium]